MAGDYYNLMKTKLLGLFIGLFSILEVKATDFKLELVKNRAYTGQFTVYEDNGVSRRAVLRFQQQKYYECFFFKITQSKNVNGSIHYELYRIRDLAPIPTSSGGCWDSWSQPKIIIVGDPKQLGAY